MAVTSGLRQGDNSAQALFNLCFAAAIAAWRDQARGSGISFTDQSGDDFEVEMLFADDAAVIAKSRAAAETSARIFAKTMQQFAPTVPTAKTKIVAVAVPDSQLVDAFIINDRGS